ncbi:flagellar rod assembly protein FlgJ [Marinomonas sp. SBI22]|uniref:glucosaminidase domain-containing protein n=1 Tax=unclassified Marinomonas TaxID=196814 RepID=UPI0007AEF94D|nr:MULTISPECIES: glucosaminidase domain-containing protein [unclassified Marinomonas]KZM39970.1 flagellar rod assembly protein FlgJ [Marinomonas sp. SBI22]KZM41264.1 flagellar rod assembly protein FlgJ [Marinomonas sp. SBI8L]
MDRKILWLISIAVVLVLWFKLGDKPAPDEQEVTQSQEAEPLLENQLVINKATPFQPMPVKPDFAKIQDIKQRKETFFQFLVPFAAEKNALLIRDRNELTRIIHNAEPPTREEKRWLAALRKIFKLKKVGVYTPENLAELYPHLDVIPESLVLAQAANESAWGTSRFALKGNNYFGQWCFKIGCGLVPESRDEDADHEVQKFKSARESVYAYIDNLNSNAAYRALRKERAKLREENKNITGVDLVSGLLPYSQRGHAYVEEIKSLISYNKLARFDQEIEKVSTTK